MSLFLRTHNPFHVPSKSLSLFSIFIRNQTSSSPQPNPSRSNKKSLCLLFQESVGLRQRAESDSETHINDFSKDLRELEKELRDLKAKADSSNPGNVNENANKEDPKKGMTSALHNLFNGEDVKTEKPKSSSGSYRLLNHAKKEEPNKEKSNSGLYNLFLDKNRAKYEARKARRKEEEPRLFKDFSPDMELLLCHLYQKGYFKDANFVPDDGRKLELSCFNDNYSRDFITFAAERFGKDNQEIAKWLSGSDLKKVALLGCPSLSKKNIFSAKQLRIFFEIQEDTVCGKCVLRHSCKFVNQSVWKGGNKNVRLADVMRVITLYALESVPAEIRVPDDVKVSVSQLLKEVINLSQTTYRANSTLAF